MRLKISKLIILVILTGLNTIKPTNSYFSDAHVVSGNILSTGYWNTGQIKPGDVVINEVMWAGSTAASTDEWIELYNTKPYAVDISNWQLKHAVAGQEGHLQIPHGYQIPAHSYFLISNYEAGDPKSALAVSADLTSKSLNLDNDYVENGSLTLLTSDATIIDQTPVPTATPWPAGELKGALHRSMQRNEVSTSGLDLTNWSSCTQTNCTSVQFWELAGGTNYGTPKSENLIDPPTPSIKAHMSFPHLNFKIIHIGNSSKAKYILTYSHDGKMEEIQGIKEKESGEAMMVFDPIYLGTCSDSSCIPHKDIKHLKVTLYLNDFATPFVWEESDI